MKLDLLKLDFSLLAAYSVATMALLVLPFSEPEFFLFGIESDKWFHAVLFAGLTMLLNWNLREQSHPSIMSLIIATAGASLVELVQSFLAYRYAEWEDLIAGVVGALVGLLVMRHILGSKRPDRAIGMLVIVLGCVIVTFSVLADVIGIGAEADFGPHQALGVVLGALIVAGGCWIFVSGFGME